MLAATLVALFVQQTAVPILHKPPLEAHATLDGQDALSANVGTLGFHEGFGFSYRHIGPPREGDTDAFLAAFAPWSFVTVGAGIEYVRLPNDLRFVQGSLALAIRPAVWLSFGVVYRPFAGLGALDRRRMDTLDLGVALRPARWLSVTAAVEQLTQPVAGGFILPRTYALGVGVRPLRSDFLTIGADVRARETIDLRQWPAPRFTLDVRPVSWLGLLLSATSTGEFFAGVTVRERFVDVGVGFGVSRAQGFQSSYAFARATTLAREGLDFSGKKTVQLGVRGDLRPGLELMRVLSGNLTSQPFGELLLELYALADRSDVSGVRIVFQGFDCGFATLHELREAILHLRAKGKHVTAELGEADDRDLYVASAADRIVMEPEAGVSFDGVRANIRNYKGLLDKLGVRVEAQTSGEYKNAPDSFTKDEPSSQQIRVQTALVENLSQSLLEAIASGRNLPMEKVVALRDKGLFSAAQAQAAGLIDELSYDPDPAAPLRPSRYDNLVNAGTTRVRRDEWNEPPCIALVEIHGTISGGDSVEDPFGLFPIAGAGTIVRALEEARMDSNVEAIVVRINSPGGDILASDFIWQAMRRAKMTKPLIVSMGDLAASGGYYAALPADVIFAEPETTTGSIGVFTFRLDLSGLLDKLGIRTTVVKRGERSDLSDMMRAASEGEVQASREYVGELYQGFLRKVAHARKMDVATADSLARGRVWSGKDALEKGLVDRMGGLMDAIAEARARAGFKPSAIVDVRPFPGAGGGKLGRFAAEVKASVGAEGASVDVNGVIDYARRIYKLFNARALYLAPDAF